MEERNKLTAKYVKDYYNKNLKNLKYDYSYFRWLDSEYSRFEFSQTKRVINNVLQDKRFNNVLEVGPGDGMWTETLLQRSEKVTAIDISEEMLKRLRGKMKEETRIEFVCEDFVENSLESDQFDLIMAIRCFEYFSNKEKAVIQFHRLLKKGGYGLVVTKNPNLFLRKKKKSFLHSDQVDINDLKKMFEKKGFQVENIFPAILGRKLGWKFFRVVFDFLHKISVSKTGFLIPGLFKKYFSESFLIFVKKI